MPPASPSLPYRRSIRLPGYDYRQSGVYFVTVCAYKKMCLFGQIRDGKLNLTELGATVAECWNQIDQVRDSTNLDAFVVMPNHIHGIIIIKNRDPAENAARTAQSADDTASRPRSDSLGSIVGQFKRAVTLRSKSLDRAPDHPIWQRNYYEHIIRNEDSLNDIRKYIVENPARWRDDSLYA